MVMRLCRIFPILLILFFGLLAGGTALGSEDLALGKQLPALQLSRPTEAAVLDHLGLKAGDESISPEDIQGRYLLIEIFSMYCPHCQHDAPGLNDFFRLLHKDEKLAHELKVIGIGAGNSEFEVQVFRDKYDVAFPLFADPELTIHSRIGDVRTPYFIGICLEEKQRGKIFFSQLAGFKDPQSFLQTIVKAAQDCGRKTDR